MEDTGSIYNREKIILNKNSNINEDKNTNTKYITKDLDSDLEE
jgi:hypothetical protein